MQRKGVGTLCEGTSKGAEGHAASIAFGKTKDDGMHIEVQWQDADSSTAKSFLQHYPDSAVMLCGGHVARAHAHFTVRTLGKSSSYVSCRAGEKLFCFANSLKCFVIAPNDTLKTVAASLNLSCMEPVPTFSIILYKLKQTPVPLLPVCLTWAGTMPVIFTYGPKVNVISMC